MDAYPGQGQIVMVRKDQIQEAFYKLFNHWVDGSSAYIKPELAIRLNTAVDRLKTDEGFATYTYQCLKNCFSMNVMAMCNVDAIGKIWRAFSARRGDQRRGELYTLLEAAKCKLSPKDRTVFEEFNRNSYSNAKEIEEHMNEFITQHGIKGLIRYVPDTFIHPQDILDFCRGCSHADQKKVKEILVRVEITDSKPDTKELPTNCLPANLSSYDQLKYILHLVAPGTLLGGRPIMVLALLAINTVLDKASREILTEKRGKWLNFNYFQQEGPMKGTPQIPENFSLGFLRMLNNHTEFLTLEEIEQVTRLLRISHILNLATIEVEVEERDPNCLDGTYYSHVRECIQCKTIQPLSLITESLVCGYCVNGIKAPIIWKDEQSIFNIQCTTCFAMYARDPKANVPGRAMCAGCRGLNPNVTAGVHDDVIKSPTQQCTVCQVNFITYHGLPNNKCGNCTHSTDIKRQRFRTRRVRAKDIFTTEEMLQVYHAAGLYADDYNVGFLKLHETVTSGEMVESSITIHPFDTIVNKDALFTKMCEFAKGSRRNTNPECDLCCNGVPPQTIGNACGRKNCTQRLCNDCGTGWYGVLTPGTIILERHLVCPFCTRKPDAKVIRRWCPIVMQLKTQGNLDPEQHYAWCVGCNVAKIVGVRQCGAAPTLAQHWQCDDCGASKTTEVPILFKECPGCSIAVDRTHGCNHITCRCGTHWCFECGTQCESAGATYEHMRSIHGRIYQHEEPIFHNDSDNEDE
jgi:hypothetical protein